MEAATRPLYRVIAINSRSLRSRNRRDPPQRRAPAGALLTHFRVTYVPERAPPLCPAQTRRGGGVGTLGEILEADS